MFLQADFGGKIFLQCSMFLHSFKSINIYSAGFLSFTEKSGPLLQP